MSQTAPSRTTAPSPNEPAGSGQTLKSATAFTVLAAVALLVRVASFCVPAGTRVTVEAAVPKG